MSALAPTRIAAASATERYLRWGSVTAVVAVAVQTVWAARSLFADGSFYLWNIVTTDNFFSYSSRALTQVVTQLPVVFLLKLGVTDISVLVRAQSFGAGAVPILLWAAALLHLRKSSLFWVWVVAFAVVFLNCGFLTIGEYNFAYAVVALSASILLREGHISAAGAVILVTLSALLFLSYETIAFQAPLLAAFALHRVFRDRKLEGWRSRSLSALLISVGLYFIAAGIACYFIVFPRDARNLSGAADFVSAYTLNPQLVVSSALGLAFVVVWSFGPGRLIALLFGLLSLPALWILVNPHLWSLGWQQYAARTASGILLTVIFGIAWIGQIRQSREARGQAAQPRSVIRALALAASAAITLVALFVPFAVRTEGFAFWLHDFEHAVEKPGTLVSLQDSGLPPMANSRYAWTWTDPFISQLLHDAPGELTILNPGETVDSHSGLPADISARFEPSRPLFP